MNTLSVSFLTQIPQESDKACLGHEGCILTAVGGKLPVYKCLFISLMRQAPHVISLPPPGRGAPLAADGKYSDVPSSFGINTRFLLLRETVAINQHS